jgi:ParB family chromosome partitioning protein
VAQFIEQTPASFTSAQLRVFLRSLIHLDDSFLKEVANHFANDAENSQQSGEEIVLAALDDTADEKLTSLALRLVLSDHLGISHKSQPDFSLRRS